MRFYWPIAKLDLAERMVWGYASTEAEDEQGEVIRRAALAAALADYMRFANIREMHQPSAVGVAEQAAVDDKGLYLGARIVDGDAWAKVAAGVYKGFSIGGHVTARDPADRKVITGLALNEISLVDRPANPEAVFDCWKRGDRADQPREPAGLEGRPQGNSGASADENIEYADPGYQPDGKQRYPIDTEAHIRAAWSYIHMPANAAHYTETQLAHIKSRIAAAWHDKIDPAGPPAAQKSMAAGSFDPPPQAGEGGSTRSGDRVGADRAAPHRLRALLAELCDLFDSLPNDGDALAAFALTGALRKSARAESAELTATVAKLAQNFANDILPRLDALQRRVEDIAQTPLPPLTAARGLSAIAKHADGYLTAAAPDDIAAALAQMTDEERTLTLIKAARAHPIMR